ncbi:hypothetical protein CPB85DRAFT_1372860 [Mucidula mucida]|nr:hypothetical protein CPB85DRAFT_1372860 [Mucidula mucida]
MSSRDSKSKKLNALAELKRTRQGGSRQYKEEEDVKIYDEVSEDNRLQRDDFVVDDGVGGYNDNGMDDFEEADEYESEDERDRKHKKKASKKTVKTESKAKTRPPVQPPAMPSMNAYRPKKTAEDESSFMADLLGDLDSAPTPSLPRSRKRKPSISDDYSSSPAPYRSRTPYEDSSSDGPVDDSFLDTPHDEFMFSPAKKLKTDVGLSSPAERLGKLDMHGSSDVEQILDDYSDIDMDFFGADIDIDDEPDVKPTVKQPPPVNKATLPQKPDPDTIPGWMKIFETLPVAEPETLGSTSTSSTSTNDVSALEDDGSLRFFWLDYLELEGKLYFTGKVKDRNTGQWVSCCVTVQGLERNLFVLPRETRLELHDDELVTTDEVPTRESVREDFDGIRRQYGIKGFKAKFVKRKYAFAEVEVPRDERDWLKVVYPFTQPQIACNAYSGTIQKVFGTNTSAFELLVLKRKIMGPCWIQIKNPDASDIGKSWCKVEYTVSDPKDFSPIPDSDPTAPKEVPPLTVVSLSVKTIVNHENNTREVVCVTARTWQNMGIDDTKPPEQLPCTVQTLVRPLGKFPPQFETRAQSSTRGSVTPVNNERMLLSSLLQSFYKNDPDIIVGHEFLGESLDVLVHRMKELKVSHWSRIGRFRRDKWPNIGKQGSNIKFLAGRLLCDLSSDAAKGMISSTTWSLTEMCKTHLKNERQDIDPDDTASYFDFTVSGPDRLLTFVRHCELDAHYQMAIASKVQILPLTKQLTNLAGNSWNKTLNGGRAERNEYILLHEFHRLKYICPDKSWGRTYANDIIKKEDKNTKAKRDKYKGGLVFEPKRGLWDKFILVMDFNSLYPSIIQEYNIDFTTAESIDNDTPIDEENLPEPPGNSIPQGVLPRLISTLVQRRRQVKSLMNDKKTSAAERLQYDIKQQALKLTANSMYGCLGFEASRFYAKPLAALTTFKGREILTHTRELAESLNLDVVYGDTDSVFVNSNVTELSEALKIAREFKDAVNKCYKLLEIDLDGVFQRLLLLQKKKYAAIKFEEGTKTAIEVKGLDMKRREYCVLSKNVSQFVLDKILSGDPTEIVVEEIHEYLTTIGQNIREGKIKLDEFIVFKRLGKNPGDYPKSEGLPHVAVARRMIAKGQAAKGGDVIPYIFCLPDSKESTKNTLADRARHPDDLRKADSDLKIDYEYYLANQILPPIERLCDPIEGTERTRLAECLGLDPARYRVTAASSFSEERAFSSLDSQISDAERFKEATPFVVTCRKCSHLNTFSAINERKCTKAECHAPIALCSMQVQLEIQIRQHIARFYEGWTVCDDPTCGFRTRMMGVYGGRCRRRACVGRVAFEYSDSHLYDQLRFYLSLFDGERAIKSSTGSSTEEEVKVLVSKHSDFFDSMTACVEKYLDQCGRRWVEMSSIFSFMKI